MDKTNNLVVSWWECEEIRTLKCLESNLSVSNKVKYKFTICPRDPTLEYFLYSKDLTLVAGTSHHGSNRPWPLLYHA